MVRAQANLKASVCGGHGGGRHGRDRELGRLASSPAPTRDCYIFNVPTMLRNGARGGGREKSGPSRWPSGEKVCQGCGETCRDKDRDPGGKGPEPRKSEILRDRDQKPGEIRDPTGIPVRGARSQTQGDPQPQKIQTSEVGVQKKRICTDRVSWAW